MILMHLRPVKVDESCWCMGLFKFFFENTNKYSNKIERDENLCLTYLGEGLLLSGKYKLCFAKYSNKK